MAVGSAAVDTSAKDRETTSDEGDIKINSMILQYIHQ